MKYCRSGKAKNPRQNQMLKDNLQRPTALHITQPQAAKRWNLNSNWNSNTDSSFYFHSPMPPYPRLSFPVNIRITPHLLVADYWIWISKWQRTNLGMHLSSLLLMFLLSQRTHWRNSLKSEDKFYLVNCFSLFYVFVNLNELNYHRERLEFLQSVESIHLNLEPLLNLSSLLQLLHLQIQ